MTTTPRLRGAASVTEADAAARARRVAAESLAAALAAKDGYTAEHGNSIAELAVEVGRELGIADAGLDDLRYAATLHDIGKIAVPDAILNKAGPLSSEEFEVIKQHPVAGERILATVPQFGRVRRFVRHSHEHWDGGGYPDGLRGEEIPLGARIVLVVDAYHAMTSDRPYRAAMSHDGACEEIKSNAGTKFDPMVADASLVVLKRAGG
jgi:HD-GYP domain-containing protein (c-di-GMP phosphodiesterase class II)